MKDWEIAQNLVATMTGGKVTPGSGNGHLKGDVVSKGWVFEVKQTAAKTMSVSRSWFSKLIRQSGDKESVIVFFFELRGYPYFKEYITQHDNDITWCSMTLKEESLPKEIYTGPNCKWVLGEWKELTELR